METKWPPIHLGQMCQKNPCDIKAIKNGKICLHELSIRNKSQKQDRVTCCTVAGINI